MKFKASLLNYSVLYQAANASKVYPYFRSSNGDFDMECISPHHGRSFVVALNNDGRYVVSKGNGLSYTMNNVIDTREFGDNVWGVLLKKDAIRDFLLGQEISSLGIKTNQMEYVLELDTELILKNGHKLKPTILQYTVECPYRICDAPFMNASVLKEFVSKWKSLDMHCYDEYYLIAANVLVKNLQMLHSHHILHNAIHVQNFTWALELLDFELACSPQYPYDKEDDNRYVKDLFSREILYTYEIINHIAWYLGENINYKRVDRIFQSYGFDFDCYQISIL